MRTVRQPVESGSVREIIFDISEETPDFLVKPFCDWLASYVGNGTEIGNEDTLQYGYTLLKCSVDSDAMRLFAPDFQSFPIGWSKDLTAAFGLLAAHKFLPESFGWESNIPSLRQTAIIGQQYDQIPMYIDRAEPTEDHPTDSGWFIGSNSEDVDNNDPEQLSVMSLYEAALAVPWITDFLSLPAGCQVVFEEDGPVVLEDYEPAPVQDGSYFQQRFQP